MSQRFFVTAQTGMHVLDIGAILLLHDAVRIACNSLCHVMAIEPNPANAKLLEASVG